jgi:hypothetical protein
MSILKDAQDNWPEDEASLTVASYMGLVADEDVSYAAAWIEKQRVHIHSIFVDAAGLDEAESLCNRYDAYLRDHGIKFTD